jgi:GT2 family glycosyltransferase
MAAHFADPDVGVVGARLLYPDGMIQHAGIAAGIMDAAGHPGRRSYRNDYWIWLEFPREVSAVTGACLAVPAALFRRLSGFDPAFPVNYNDVDFCLRVRQAGLRVVIDSEAVLEHAECATRSPHTSHGERLQFFERWADMLQSGDPFYCRWLRKDTENPELDFDFRG